MSGNNCLDGLKTWKTQRNSFFQIYKHPARGKQANPGVPQANPGPSRKWPLKQSVCNFAFFILAVVTT